ncbi:wax ester synthase/diacylglycerol acyltransferase 11-like [Apium graveolens]|uniref:wax ester synthase/diacylglycerol acyltransferase 11-like n=1 Tax=Apium graveolens TaxID=4045 RepID=UPI003D78FBDD
METIGSLKPLNIERSAAENEMTPDDEPLSPPALLFQTPRLKCYVMATMGSKTKWDPSRVKLGLENTLAKHPRFSSLLVMDERNDGKMRWRKTKVNVDEHVFVPKIDLDKMEDSADEADKYVEDYISDLHKTKMDYSKPLWELHILNIKTSGASGVVVFKVHHSIGDGISLMSSLLACTRQSSNPMMLPTLPTSSRVRSHSSSKPKGLWCTFWTMISMVFNTFVDILILAATALFLKDTDTPIKGSPESGYAKKRMVHKLINLKDIKLVKTAMNTTINDVLFGVTEAGLSRYLNGRYASKQGENAGYEMASKTRDFLPKGLRVRAALYVNLRPSAGIEAFAKIMGNETKLESGNKFGYVLLPFEIGLRDDPLDYIRRAKATLDRKKLSFEAVCSFAIGLFVHKSFGLQTVASLMHNIVSKTTVSFSNVVGPQEEISLYGHPLAYVAPTVYGAPQALTMHWQSCGDKMVLILTVDSNVIPDPHKLCTDMEVSLNSIKDTLSKRGLITVK